MSSDEKPPISELKPEELIIDETYDLLSLYALENPTERDVEEALSQHYDRYKRIGFDSELDEETLSYFLKHFTSNSKEYLNAELQFIQEIKTEETNNVVIAGFERAVYFLPEQDYRSPQMVMLLNGMRTDAKVLGDNQFGVNLQNLFGRVFPKDSSTYDMKKARQQLHDICAHEGSHIFLNQVEHSDKRDVNWVVHSAFGEGLAVLSESKFNYPWSEDYLAEAGKYLEILKTLQKVDTDSDRIRLINAVCKMSSLQKHKPDFIAKAQKQLEDGLMDENKFGYMLRELLVRKNGPLYYAGYSIWQRIYENEGLERVKDVVKKGPKEFETYF